MSGKYDDIIDMPHHVSAAHQQMPAIERAAQFAPFAALTGYNAAVKETARLTDTKLELDENEKETLNQKLRFLAEQLKDMPSVSITYFRPDEIKAGGAYVQVSDIVRKIDVYHRVVVMRDGSKIPIDGIIEIESSLL